MRKVVVFNMITLDGFYSGPNGDIDWHNTDEEFNDFAVEHLNTLDTLLFGRVTYEGMASYWPTPMAIESDPAVAGQMNRIAKIVFSRTLDKVTWENTRLVKDHIPEEIAKLKQQPGKDMAILGSGNLTAEFTRLGLVDEFRLMVNPVILGKGVPLFKDIEQQVKLKLVQTRPFKSGNMLLYYQPAQA